MRQQSLETHKKARILNNKIGLKGNHKVDHEREIFFLKLHMGEDPLTYKPRPQDMIPRGGGYYHDFDESSSEVFLTPTESEASLSEEGKPKIPKWKRVPKRPATPVDEEAVAALLEVPPKQRRPVTQYQRYFDEAYEQEIACKNDLDLFMKLKTEEYDKLKSQIADLRAEKDALVQRFDVYRVEDVDGLWLPIPHEQRANPADFARREEKGKGRAVEGGEGVWW